MLTHFEARNYKSIRSLSVDVPEIMVLVGPNGSGKTNIVRALELFGEVVRRGSTDPVSERGYSQLIRREKKPARAGISFSAHIEVPVAALSRPLALAPGRRSRAQHIKVKLGVTVSGSVTTDEVRVTSEELTFIDGDNTLSVKITGDEVAIDGDDEFLLSLLLRDSVRQELGGKSDNAKDFLRASLQRESGDPDDNSTLRLVNWQRMMSPWMRYVRESLAVSRIRLDASALRRDSSFEDSGHGQMIGGSGEGLASAVARLRGLKTEPSLAFVQILQSLQKVYPRIEDVMPIQILPGRLVLSFRETGISESLGQESISDGVLHALALLVALKSGPRIRSGVLAIEEPENALHPWSLRSIMHLAQANNIRRQRLVITTHSATVVSSVSDPQYLFVVENDGSGTQITPATEKENALTSIIASSGLKLGEIWVDGSIGGVPGSVP